LSTHGAGAAYLGIFEWSLSRKISPLGSDGRAANGSDIQSQILGQQLGLCIIFLTRFYLYTFFSHIFAVFLAGAVFRQGHGSSSQLQQEKTAKI